MDVNLYMEHLLQCFLILAQQNLARAHQNILHLLSTCKFSFRVMFLSQFSSWSLFLSKMADETLK